MTSVHVGWGCYFLPSLSLDESMFVPIISLHYFVSTLTWEKNSHHPRKKLAVDWFWRNPQRGRRRGKKQPLFPSILPGAPRCPGSAQVSQTTELCLDSKPMLCSLDRNSANPEPLTLTPPLAGHTHMGPNNQVTALIVTISSISPEPNTQPCHFRH